MRARRRLARASATALAALFAVVLGGCSTHHPQPLSDRDLAQARIFPFYTLYWAGRTFEHQPVTATDGLDHYNNSIGEGIQYGDCIPGRGVLHTGSCVLPLEIVTVVWRPHCNRSLGAQRNTLIRGVPATVFDGGLSVEVYTGHVAVDVYADTPGRALRAARALRPLNAAGGAADDLPPPTYRPGLVPPVPAFRIAPAAVTRERFGRALPRTC